MIDTEKLGYKEYKCNKCGWVHAALPLADVVPDLFNVKYCRCFLCGAVSRWFVPAEPNNAPAGSQLQSVYVPGAWEC